MLDTSTVVLLARLGEVVLPPRLVISAITLAELGVGPLVAKTSHEQIVRHRHLRLADRMEVLQFDERCARAFTTLAARLRVEGSKRRARAYDTLIAATAIANRVPLYTANPRDFDGMPELDLCAVPVADD